MAIESAHEFSVRITEPIFRINGDRRDSQTEWEDVRNDLIRTSQLGQFLGPVGDEIPWSNVENIKRFQERAVVSLLSALVKIGTGSATVRGTIRKIENNKLTDPGVLAQDVDKIRQIIED
jgi:hypothetical protein